MGLTAALKFRRLLNFGVCDIEFSYSVEVITVRLSGRISGTRETSEAREPSFVREAESISVLLFICDGES